MTSLPSFVVFWTLVTILVVNQILYWRRRQPGKPYFLSAVSSAASSVAGGLLGGGILAVIGLVVGTLYGGNYATDFRFNSLRGYEATGVLGAIIGYTLGAPLGAFLLSRRRTD